jgi:predicted adenylyl cyclase CyaB
VKFHLDQVKDLGSFVEIEAISENAEDTASLERQVASYVELFGISSDDMLSDSYSDMILTLQAP